MEDDEIKKNIDEAIQALEKETRPLNFSDVSERAIAHRLAVHMEYLFEGWNIDCEYNRDGILIKKLNDISQCSAQKKTDKIYPDIIVHHRVLSEKGSNLLVIELKNNSEKDACDQKKLELMTKKEGYFKYQLGLYINVNGGKFCRTWYKDGAQMEKN